MTPMLPPLPGPLDVGHLIATMAQTQNEANAVAAQLEQALKDRVRQDEWRAVQIADMEDECLALMANLENGPRVPAYVHQTLRRLAEQMAMLTESYRTTGATIRKGQTES